MWDILSGVQPGSAFQPPVAATLWLYTFIFILDLLWTLCVPVAQFSRYALKGLLMIFLHLSCYSAEAHTVLSLNVLHITVLCYYMTKRQPSPTMATCSQLVIPSVYLLYFTLLLALCFYGLKAFEEWNNLYSILAIYRICHLVGNVIILQ